MVRPVVALLTLFLGALLAPASTAAGTLQLVVHGQVHRDGGTPVELFVRAGGSEATFQGVVGRDTRATDLVSLFEGRLKKAGIRHSRGHDAPGQGPVSLFVEDVELLRVRLGGGLRATVTACDEAPRAVTLLPSRLEGEPLGAFVSMTVTCASSDGARILAKDVDLDLNDVETTPERVAELLARRASQSGLRSLRPNPKSWATSGATTGEAAIGLSIELYADSDWGIELELEPRVSRR